MNEKYVNMINAIEGVGTEVERFITSPEDRAYALSQGTNGYSFEIMKMLSKELMPKLENLASSIKLKSQILNSVQVNDTVGEHGGSRLGGIPYWSATASEDVRKIDGMSFVAQINLSDLPFNPYIQKTGILQFFYNEDFNSLRSNAVVYHKDVNKALTPQESRSNLSEITLKPSNFTNSRIIDMVNGQEMTFSKVITKVDPPSNAIEKFYLPSITKYIQEEFDKYPDLSGLDAKKYASFIIHDVELIIGNSHDYYNSNVFGLVGSTQYSTEELIKPFEIILLQLDSNKYFQWGHNGIGHWKMTLKDAKKRDFNNVKFHWDCY